MRRTALKPASSYLTSASLLIGVRCGPTTFAHRRRLVTLAIETSCDDTAVAILEKHDSQTHDAPNARLPTAKLLFNEKITANNLAYRGIHPIVSLESHQANLAQLIQRAVQRLPEAEPHNAIPSSHTLVTHDPDGTSVWRQKPDFISVTRGPGMRSSLATGLDTAKGLAVAWQVPLVGVHHMQAHALTPRLVSLLETQPQPPSQENRRPCPSFPFFSLLVSGGHTLLVFSESITSHRILASTNDIAIGEALDKIARHILPDEILKSASSTMYGPILEKFAFSLPNHETASSDGYKPPQTHNQSIKRRLTRWGWGVAPPLGGRDGSKTRSMEYSFSGLVTAVQRFMGYQANSDGSMTLVPRKREDITMEERVVMAYEAMRVAFEHLASRVVLAVETELGSSSDDRSVSIDLVVSGGVAANQFLRKVLSSYFQAQLQNPVCLNFPPTHLCTDNAAMIAWAGMEMYEMGMTSSLGIGPLREWSLDSSTGEGILRAGEYLLHGKPLVPNISVDVDKSVK